MKNKLKNIKTWHIFLALQIIDLFNTENEEKIEYAMEIIRTLNEEDRVLIDCYFQSVINYLYK